MNKIEELVYHAVKKNPALKQFIRNIYQSAFDCLPKQKNQFKINWFSEKVIFLDSMI